MSGSNFVFLLNNKLNLHPIKFDRSVLFQSSTNQAFSDASPIVVVVLFFLDLT